MQHERRDALILIAEMPRLTAVLQRFSSLTKTGKERTGP
jgi:hypothetical protein